MSVVDLASALVKISSVSGDDCGMNRVQDAVINFVSAQDSAVVVDRYRGSRPWTLLSTPAALKKSEPAVVFACHTDTVPITSPDLWTTDPLGGAIDGDRLLGRGSVDMKGGLAAAVFALVAATKRGTPAHLLLTADEEIGSRGAANAVEAVKKFPVKGIVIPEATNLDVHSCHRGATWYTFNASGKAAHGSTPHLGSNAIETLTEALIRWKSSQPLETDRRLGTESLNIGTIRGGNATNIVPDWAAATIDFRTVTQHAPMERLSGLPDLIDVGVDLDLAPLTTPQDNEFVTALPAQSVAEPVPYFTDGSVLTTALPGIPIVVWGPGEPHQMHSVDESIELDQLERAVDLFSEVLV